ncbi:MAG: hypothetical protein H0Z32_04465 [Bacillaceae bacterium]|nr:hypothetical protein [Bacillaceae bacterium]
MRLRFVPFLIIVSAFIMSACSGERSVEVDLVSVKSEIVKDDSKAGTLVIKKEDETYTVVPVALYYEFKFKNSGNQKIKLEDKLDIRIEPSKELKSESFDLLDKDIFVRKNGWSLPPMPFKPGETKTANIYYHLGKYEGDSVIPAFPDEAELEGLKELSLNADLVVLYKGEEIARYDLSDFK